MLAYPVDLTPDGGAIVVTFPDVPEAITYGEDEADALLRAVDALETALSIYVDDRRDLPQPSPAAGRPTVAPRALSNVKLQLYRTMRDAGVGRDDLARRLGWPAQQVDRLLDLDHASRLDQLEAALAALGKQLRIELRDAA